MSDRTRPSAVLIDDHELFRQGLHALLGAHFDVLASGSTGREAGELCERFNPDLLILDVETGSDPAETTIRAIRRKNPEVVIVVLTMYDDPILRRQLLQAGATDYATKAIDQESLVERLHASMQAGPAMMRQEQRPADTILTQRELEVIRLVAAAASNRDISRSLSISEGTVKRHLANVFIKLGASSRIDAVMKARRHGLLAGGAASGSSLNSRKPDRFT